MRVLPWMGAAGLLLGSACRTAETPQAAKDRMDQETAAFRQAADVVQRNYERFTNEAKADSVASLYTEQGRNMPPNAQSDVGRAAIVARENQNNAVYSFKLAIKSENAVVNGPIAIETGTYHVEGTVKPGAPRGTPPLNEDGKYMAHWHQVNGQWLIADLIWNSNQPLPTAAPPARTPGNR